ncbi:MAG: CbtA family protein [Nitrospinota bacterium]|nr:CbtA family protein [Nitrospinota bacterium]
MFQRIIFSASIAGLLSGILLTFLQHVWIIPIIRNAEKLEIKSAHNTKNTHHNKHVNGRMFSNPNYKSLIANTITSIAFALLMISSGGFVKNFDAKRGLFWGIAGFIIFSLMPSIVITPKLPGDISLPLSEHNMLWILTTTCTAIGLLFIIFFDKNSAKFFGLVVILFPHLVSYSFFEIKLTGELEILQEKFHLATLIISLIFWSFLGITSGYFFKKLSPNLKKEGI